jgi:hypothetical protein
MHYYITKHILKRLACLLAATLILTYCTTIVNAKSMKIKRFAESSPEALKRAED